MKVTDRVQMLRLTTKDLFEAVEVYTASARSKLGYGWVPLPYTKEAIKRRITQLRQDLLLLEKELERHDI